MVFVYVRVAFVAGIDETDLIEIHHGNKIVGGNLQAKVIVRILDANRPGDFCFFNGARDGFRLRLRRLIQGNHNQFVTQPDLLELLFDSVEAVKLFKVRRQHDKIDLVEVWNSQSANGLCQHQITIRMRQHPFGPHIRKS